MTRAVSAIMSLSLGVTQLNAQSQHQKRLSDTPGWLSQDYSAIVLVSSAIHRRRTQFPTPDESGNYSIGTIRDPVGNNDRCSLRNSLIYLRSPQVARFLNMSLNLNPRGIPL